MCSKCDWEHYAKSAKKLEKIAVKKDVRLLREARHLIRVRKHCQRVLAEAITQMELAYTGVSPAGHL